MHTGVHAHMHMNSLELCQVPHKGGTKGFAGQRGEVGHHVHLPLLGPHAPGRTVWRVTPQV